MLSNFQTWFCGVNNPWKMTRTTAFQRIHARSAAIARAQRWEVFRIFFALTVASQVAAFSSICLGTEALQQESAVSEMPRLAELTLADPSDGTQAYAGKPYVWLGRYNLCLIIQGPLREGLVLSVSAGAKNDQRGFAFQWIQGQKTLMSGVKSYGGYDGFQDLLLEVPATTGDNIELRLAAAPEKPAFFAQAVLLQRVRREDLPTSRFSLQVKLEPIKREAVIPRGPTEGGFASRYPEMQAIWNAPGEPSPDEVTEGSAEWAFRQAARNGGLANEMFFRANKYMHGWLEHADPETGLIPRNLSQSRDIWNPQDAAADNYPFMVLTAYLTERELFFGRMLEMLKTETRLTSRLGALPDAWSFSKKGFVQAEPQLAVLIFGGSEYVKDGLLPLTEFFGPSPWLERLIAIEDAIWKEAPLETPWGPIPSDNVEVNGEQLQALSRLFWLTGDHKYLDWAKRLGDYYLLGPHHPTRDMQSLRLRDHGCEIVSGLCELYVAVYFVDREKAEVYREPIHAMCDRILEVGRDSRGMLYNSINPQTGTHDPNICDTWGYNYNGIYSVYLIDKTPEYREAVRLALSSLENQVGDYHWGSADEYADSIESAINLYNREPIPSAARWIDRKIHDMWRPQQPNGIIEGWHGDGNVARTGIMYAFWKTQGLRVEPWREDLRLGAVLHDHRLYVTIGVSRPWQGRLIFDRPRHRHYFHLPLDYPRINQFPEWFAVDESQLVCLSTAEGQEYYTATAEEAWQGITITLDDAGEWRWIVVTQPNK
ncbi:MAG: hypothetical protein ACUVQG_09065 [Thermogutta sp.]